MTDDGKIRLSVESEGLIGFSARDKFPSLAKCFEHMRNVWKIGTKALNSIEWIDYNEEDHLFKSIVFFMAGKALKTHLAIEHLLESGCHEDAAILLRSVLESLINLSYIAQDPLKRSRRYIDYNFVESHLLHRNTKQLPGKKRFLSLDNYPDEIRKIKDEYNNFKKKYGEGGTWSGLTNFKMVKKINDDDLIKLYLTFYSYYSQYVHSSPGALLNYIKENDNELNLQLSPQKDHKNLCENLIQHICMYSMRIVKLLGEVFDLDIEDDINSLYTEHMNIFKTE